MPKHFSPATEVRGRLGPAEEKSVTPTMHENREYCRKYAANIELIVRDLYIDVDRDFRDKIYPMEALDGAESNY